MAYIDIYNNRHKRANPQRSARPTLIPLPSYNGKGTLSSGPTLALEEEDLCRRKLPWIFRVMTPGIDNRDGAYLSSLGIIARQHRKHFNHQHNKSSCSWLFIHIYIHTCLYVYIYIYMRPWAHYSTTAHANVSTVATALKSRILRMGAGLRFALSDVNRYELAKP